jgi:hypothetical protein
MDDEKLTKEECEAILNRYANWNTGQTSISLAMKGVRTREDEILDERRELILAVTQRLRELAQRTL